MGPQSVYLPHLALQQPKVAGGSFPRYSVRSEERRPHVHKE